MHALTNNWTHCLQLADIPLPQSATLGLHPIAPKLLVISYSTEGRRLSWSERQLHPLHSLYTSCSAKHTFLASSASVALKKVYERLCIVCFEFYGQACGNIKIMHCNYLRQGGNVFAGLCLSVCLSVCVCKITQKVMDGSFWNFEGMSGMAYTTSDSIFGVIRQESWILDHFEIFVTIALMGE